MNIKERYPETKTMTHDETYDFLISQIGFTILKNFMPETNEKIKEAYKKDKNLNNIPLHKWEEEVPSIKRLFLTKCNINISSISECVCLLKACARQITTK